MIFVCPKCGGKLNIDKDRSAFCALGHRYDRSREGYYNLLLSNAGGIHGDNAEMIKARSAFLDKGYYAPLADILANTALRLAPSAESLVDAGCGEGYYTERVIKAYTDGRGKDFSDAVNAFDISKAAVKRAAKRCRGANFAVATSYGMPIADNTVDILINTFSPLAESETARVLKRGGVFLMAIPAEEHLFELKAAIYDAPYKNEVQPTRLEGFALLEEKKVAFKIQLNSGDDIRNLFMMTPYAYRTSQAGREKIMALEKLECSADFILLAYKKL